MIGSRVHGAERNLAVGVGGTHVVEFDRRQGDNALGPQVRSNSTHRSHVLMGMRYTGGAAELHRWCGTLLSWAASVESRRSE